MSANVELASLQAAQGGVKICKHELEDAIKTLKNRYQYAATYWNDDKYLKLGVIIEDCCNDLSTPIREIDECIKGLKGMIRAVQDYESSL